MPKACPLVRANPRIARRVSRFEQLTRLSLWVLRRLADVLGQSSDETSQLRHAPEERLVVVASLVYRIDHVHRRGMFQVSVLAISKRAVVATESSPGPEA